MFGAEHSGERRIAGAQCLSERENVRLEWKLVVREPAARASETGHDLVKDDQEAVAVAPLGKTLPEPLRRRVARERGGADRLADERGDRFGPRRFEQTIELRQSLAAALVETPCARCDVQMVGQVGLVRVLE